MKKSIAYRIISILARHVDGSAKMAHLSQRHARVPDFMSSARKAEAVNSNSLVAEFVIIVNLTVIGKLDFFERSHGKPNLVCRYRSCDFEFDGLLSRI